MLSIAWSSIDWLSLAALSLLVLVAARVGVALSLGNRGAGALITALVFAVGFAVWSYSLHDSLKQSIAMLLPASPG